MIISWSAWSALGRCMYSFFPLQHNHCRVVKLEGTYAYVFTKPYIHPVMAQIYVTQTQRHPCKLVNAESYNRCFRPSLKQIQADSMLTQGMPKPGAQMKHNYVFKLLLKAFLYFTITFFPQLLSNRLDQTQCAVRGCSTGLMLSHKDSLVCS